MKATRLWVPLAFWCILCAFRSLAQEESLTVVGTVIARMQYGDRYYNVHPMASDSERFRPSNGSSATCPCSCQKSIGMGSWPWPNNR